MIPDELKQHDQWVTWRPIERSGKSTKVPFQPNGRPAKSTDPETWSAFSSVEKSKRKGFVFSQADPYIGIDLDGCRDPQTGKLDDWAREIVLKFQTYAEVSPSQTGVKLIGVSDSIWKCKNKVDLEGTGHGGKSPGIEVYDCGRYFTVTGRSLKGCSELKNVDSDLEWLANEFKMHPMTIGVDGSQVALGTPLEARASKYLAKMDPSISGSSGHNACFKAACALVLGFSLPTDTAFQLLASEYNQRCEPPWSEKELWHKVKSAAKQPGQRGYLADANPSEWSKIFVRSGNCEPDPEPDEGPSGVRRTRLRDAAMDHLEKVINGEDVLYETGIPDLDYAIGGGVAPGEMVIVAARPGHGKSAIAMQMVHHMTEKHPAVIVSEEMSALAIGKRTVQFASDVPEEHWRAKDTDVLSDLDYHFSNRKEALIIESCGTAKRATEEIEKAVEETGAKLVAVDYVQLLGAKGGSRYEQVTAASQELRRLSSRLNIVLVVLAQLSRAIEHRKQFIPTSSDLKESGQIEQDADVIIFGVWPHKIQPSLPMKEYSFFIGKNRSRAVNQAAFTVEFEPHRQRLVEEASAIRFSKHEEFAEWE